MHAFTRTRWTALTALLALSFVVSIATTAWGKPAPDYRGRGFRLFARANSNLGGNRVSCGLAADGRICPDSLGSSTAAGGFWPRGTLNQYVFNSGLQLAGIIDSAAPLSWAGSKDGAFFFNARGGNNGIAVTNIWRSSDPSDKENWPEAANVPIGDATADLYSPAIQGRKTASDQDIWFMAWEGDPSRLAGREHPLGVAVETRGMAFATAGKEDFIFFVYTFYNVTCAQASCYASARPSIQDTLLSLGQRFQSLNSAKFGETMPLNGYRIQGMYAAFGADMDVTNGNSGSNYDGVNVPFAMGYTYEESFQDDGNWKYDPQIFRPPFFAAPGFIGVKYLKSPIVNGVEVGLSLFGATTNGGEFSDPPNTKALYRYLSGTNSAATGDDECNVGDVKVTKICYINQGASADMRFFQSSGPLTLDPSGANEFSSIVVAYIFAAPLASGACAAQGCSSLQPQSPTNSLTGMLTVDTISNPALCCNSVDSMTGYRGFVGDTNGNGLPDQNELIVVNGSLLGKAITAQAIFNAKFAQPLPPDPPTFYTIAGNNQVTVLWQQSSSEITGDPYWDTAQTPLQYDPNYRKFDVMGYRVYRNRNGDPVNMTLLAQYNYTDKTFTDYTGQLNGADESGAAVTSDEWGCWAPLGIFNTCTDAGLVFGVPTIDPITHNLAAEGLVQATNAVALLNLNAQITASDTAYTGGINKLVCGVASTCPGLESSGGVPFVYFDNTAKNNLTYYYTVTAFDANSIRSGPSSLESARVLAKVIPSAPNSNVQSSGSTTLAGIFGRGVNVSTLNATVPTLDPTTGTFSGKMPPSDAVVGGVAGQFLAPLFQGSGYFDLLLTDLTLGDARNGVPTNYTYRGVSEGDTVDFIGVASIQQGLDGTGGSVTGSTPPFPAIHVNAAQAALLGVSPNFLAPAQVTMQLESYQVTNSEGRGCLGDGSIVPPAGYDCIAWGPRWFQGANESVADPNAGTGTAGSNAGTSASLAGVNAIQWPSSFANMNNNWRNIDAALGGAIRASDMAVYWGAAGHVDSVIDLTYNVPVPFDSLIQGAGWAIIDQASTNAAGSYDLKPALLTAADFGCLAPFWDGTDPGPSGRIPCSAAVPFVGQSTAVAGPIAFASGSQTALRTAPALANPGFGMTIAGEWFLFELAPAASVPSNTVWTLRSYIGSIFNSTTDNSYLFEPGLRTFSAVGAAVRINYTAFNGIVTSTDPQADLANVHTVPDPYYVTSQFERTTDAKEIKFVNLPANATIRIYTSSGVLVQILEHTNKVGGTETWGVRNRNGQFVASGVYFYSVEDADTGARKVGRMTIVQYAR